MSDETENDTLAASVEANAIVDDAINVADNIVGGAVEAAREITLEAREDAVGAREVAASAEVAAAQAQTVVAETVTEAVLNDEQSREPEEWQTRLLALETSVATGFQVMGEALANLGTLATQAQPSSPEPEPEPETITVETPEGTQVTVEPENADAGAPRGTGTGTRSAKGSKASALHLETIASALVGIHSIAAAASGISQLTLSEDEAKSMATAASNVARHYDVGISEKAADWTALAICLGQVYAPRVGAFIIERESSSRQTAPSRPAAPRFEVVENSDAPTADPSEAGDNLTSAASVIGNWEPETSG